MKNEKWYIRRCRDLWTWVAKTGEEKYDWPGWDKDDENHPRCYEGQKIKHSCFSCQHTMDKNNLHYNIDCRDCFLMDTWTSNVKRPYRSYACEYFLSSPYKQWQNTSKPIHALKIANACRKLLGQKKLALKGLNKDVCVIRTVGLK